MEIATRSLWTLIHGMGFGALYLLPPLELLLRCIGAMELILRHNQ